MITKQVPGPHHARPTHEANITRVVRDLALGIVSLLVMGQAVCFAGFFLGYTISVWHILLCLAAWLVVLVWLHHSLLHTIALAVAVLLLVAASIIFTSYIPDLSFDGWAYHQPSIIAFAKGWNPIHDPILGSWWAATFGQSEQVQLPSVGGSGIWGSFYPKGSWILGALSVAAHAPLDSAKFTAPLLLSASAFAVYRACLLFRLGNKTAFVLALVAGCNPVVVAQLSTTLVDGLLASALTMSVFGSISWLASEDPRDLLTVTLSGIFAASLKFTGLVYAGSIVGLLLIFAVLTKVRWKKTTGTVAFSVVLSGIVLWNPYITNTLLAGYPFHPLQVVDIMEPQMGESFLKKNRFEKLVIALTCADTGWPSSAPTFAPLKDRSLAELRHFGTLPAPKIGGFGPFFFLSILGASILVILRLQRRRLCQNERILCWGIVAVFCSAILNPEVWWARYAPQLWLIPVLALMLNADSPLQKFTRLAVIITVITTLLVQIPLRAAQTLWEYNLYTEEMTRLPPTKTIVVSDGFKANYHLATFAYRMKSYHHHDVEVVNPANCAAKRIMLGKVELCLARTIEHD